MPPILTRFAAAYTRDVPIACFLAAALLVADADDEQSRLETITVTAKGETRQVQRVRAEDARALPPGTSPLKLLEQLPGVHFESADAFGSYEWSARISLRGFDQTRLGFTLDGIPLGDMSYGNNNGLHVSRALIAENLGVVELAPGIGSLGTPSTSNLGGTLQFYSDEPVLEPALRLARTFGSNGTSRTYVRLDSGDHGGFSGYVSAVAGAVDKWKGEGDQQQRQLNARARFDFGANRISALIASSRRDENDYADLSLDSTRRLGYDWDNYAPDWERAVLAARGVYSGGANQIDDAYFRGRGLRDDDLLGLSGEFALGDALAARATAYWHANRGQGHWFTPYRASSPEVPISIRTTEYGIERSGATGALTWRHGRNALEAGFWIEDSVHGLQRNFYDLDGPLEDDFFLRDPDLRVFHQRFDTRTRQWYVQDTLKLLDESLTLQAGFKSPRTTTRAQSFVGSRAGGEIVARDPFVPQAGFSWRSGTLEWFASYAENLAAFRPGVAGPFSASQDAFDAFGASLKPERSRALEAGVRRNGAHYEAALAFYGVRFEDRQLAISRCAGIVGCPTGFANVGAVRSRGAELTFVYTPAREWRWVNALSLNRTRYADDYLDGDTLVATAGKTVVDAPKVLASSELAWRSAPWELRLAAKYTGARYITYLDDSAVPGFWLVDASAAYDFGSIWRLEGLRVQLAGTNLLDRRYFATVGSNGFVASDPAGQNFTLLAGAPRLFFLSVEGRW
jgi:iron complex outermembrane receptor protein